jgi:hypothetical protein
MRAIPEDLRQQICAADPHLTNAELARRLGLERHTVGKYRAEHRRIFREAAEESVRRTVRETPDALAALARVLTLALDKLESEGSVALLRETRQAALALIKIAGVEPERPLPRVGHAGAPSDDRGPGAPTPHLDFGVRRLQAARSRRLQRYRPRVLTESGVRRLVTNHRKPVGQHHPRVVVQSLGHRPGVFVVSTDGRLAPRLVLVCVGHGQNQVLDVNHHKCLNEVPVDGVPHPGTSSFDF